MRNLPFPRRGGNGRRAGPEGPGIRRRIAWAGDVDPDDYDGLRPGGQDIRRDLPRFAEAEGGRRSRDLGPQPNPARASQVCLEGYLIDEGQSNWEAPAGIGRLHFAGTGRYRRVPEMGGVRVDQGNQDRGR